MANTPMHNTPGDSLEVSPARLTACADAMLDVVVRNDEFAAKNLMHLFTENERIQARAFMVRLGMLHPSMILKGGLEK